MCVSHGEGVAFLSITVKEVWCLCYRHSEGGVAYVCVSVIVKEAWPICVCISHNEGVMVSGITDPVKEVWPMFVCQSQRRMPGLYVCVSHSEG